MTEQKTNETTLKKMFPHIAGYNEIRQEASQIVDLFQTRSFIAIEELIIQRAGSSMACQERGRPAW